MNFKGLVYKTEWVESPDIEPLAKKLGAAPTSKKYDGRDHYTLPITYDPSTKSTIPDSLAIAFYLEETYPPPTYPALFPEHTKSLTAILPAALRPIVNSPLFEVLALDSWRNLGEISRVSFRRTNEAEAKKKLEDFAPEGEEGEIKWRVVEEGLSMLNKWLNAGGGPFLTGDQVAYADILVAARLIWARVVLGLESKKWKMIAGWNGGRWGRFLQNFEEYERIL